MDTVWLAALLGALMRCAVARPQGPSSPSGPGAAPMAPAPFTSSVPGPGPGPAFVPILQQHFEQSPDGQFRWSYAAADGTAQEAMGELTASRAIAVQGSYSYPSPEGQVQVKYVADEYGFQPTGAHIHPAILEAVRRQVEQARSEAPNLYNDAGFPAGPGQAGVGPAGQPGLGPVAGSDQPLQLPPPLPNGLPNGLPPHPLGGLASAPSGSALL